jgi:hypothetical protein
MSLLESIVGRAIAALEGLDAVYGQALSLEKVLTLALLWSFRQEFFGDAGDFRLDGWQGAQ